MARSFEDNRLYHDVQPTTPAKAHPDAIVLKFTSDTKVDDTKALGMKVSESLYGRTFCVAPVLIEGQQRVEYWAAGVDCCTERGGPGHGGFTCDEADQVGVSQATVVRDTVASD